MGKNIKYDELFKRYLDNTCAVEEIELLLGYFDTTDEQNLRQLIYKALSESNDVSLPDASLKQHISDLYVNILARMKEKDGKKVSVIPFYKTKSFLYLAAACITLMVASLATLFYNSPGTRFKNFTAEVTTEDIAPGGNRATLTLGDGQVIILNEAADGELVNSSGIIIRKTGNGQLVYEVTGNGGSQNGSVYNTISTPKGGTYQIVLPDGTRVWLNAASTLKFPSTFSNLMNRKVELSGEAYFEAVKDKKHPFIVETNKQAVEVLGTHFNVNAYSDEQSVKTTLLEGSVKVSSRGLSDRRDNRKEGERNNTVVLKPGEQALNDGKEMKVQTAALREVTAWKNGDFEFNEEPLFDIVKKLERWYDVEIILSDKLAVEEFTGKITRSRNISQVLMMIEKANNISFKIEGRRITAIEK